jgi:tripartite-type tricarboxylate transporter receptor subunit TctC
LFTIVGQEFHHMLVTPNLPAKDVKEFVVLAKSKPEGLTFASAGPGSAPFLGMQRFIQTAAITNMVHVPFPGSNPAVLSLVQGDVHAMLSSPSTTLPLTLEGKVRGLAVAGPNRDPNAPNIPTFAESGYPGFESTTWFALIVSSKVPPDVLSKIRADVAEAMRSPTVLQRIRDIKSVPVGNTAEQFRTVMKTDFDAFEKALKDVK